MKRLSPHRFFTSLAAKARETRMPETVTFELTYGCNLRCVHCYNPTHRVLPQELSTEEVFSILDQCADVGVVTLTFTGGEPFVRPDVFAIFEHAKRLGMLLELISNATRITPEIADRLQQANFRSLAISIYGATKDTYELVTGMPGSFGPFIRGLECLISRRLPVIVRMPVMTDNAHEVQDARTLVEGMGIRFQYCVDIHPKTNGDTSPLLHRLSPADKVRIDLAMLGPRDQAAADEPCARNGGFIECACGQTKFAITPYGEMNLCQGFPMPKYDLRKGTVKEGWEVLKQTVDGARPNDHYECPTCDVRDRCRQGRNDAWLATGDMSVCLPHYKELATLEKKASELDVPSLFRRV
ncbi:MAG: radical SAM protein [Thaumarchaeota archaeon]|nr:MAG: radical SAM protein [Nitrososphaerota archaeon]